MDMSGFASFAERIDARKVRERSPSFFDHFSQARLFFNSQTEVEQNHIIRALRFELGKVETPPIRERMLFLLAQVDRDLADRVAVGLGLKVPAKLDKPLNMSFPADGDPKKFQPKKANPTLEESQALSMVENPNFPKDTIKTRKVAFLVADGFQDDAVSAMKMALATAGAKVCTVAPRLGVLTGENGEIENANFSLLTGSSVLVDAVYVPGGQASIAALMARPESAEFISEAYKHCKTIAATAEGIELLRSAGVLSDGQGSAGVFADPNLDAGELAQSFIEALAQHRHWEREPPL
jgi:catalase